MSELPHSAPPLPPEIDQANRRALAVGLYNHCWELLEIPDRTLEQDAELIHAAHASRYHWGEIRTPSAAVAGRVDVRAGLLGAKARRAGPLACAASARARRSRGCAAAEEWDSAGHLRGDGPGIVRGGRRTTQGPTGRRDAGALAAARASADDRQVIERDLATLAGVARGPRGAGSRPAARRRPATRRTPTVRVRCPRATTRGSRRGCRTRPPGTPPPSRSSTSPSATTGATPGTARPAAVNDLSLAVPAGKICVLVGPSGCGKTTSLKMVNRLVEPTVGPDPDRRHGRRRPGRHRAAPRASATSSSRSACSPTRRSPRTWRRCPGCSAGPRRGGASGPRSCSTSSGSTRRRTRAATRSSSRAASSSASGSPGRSPPTRRSCSWTSRSAPSTRSSASGSRTSSCASRRRSARRSSSSPTTSTRPSRWATASPSSPRAACWPSSARRPRSWPARQRRSSPASSAATAASSA